jgi:hypothetical protein
MTLPLDLSAMMEMFCVFPVHHSGKGHIVELLSTTVAKKLGFLFNFNKFKWKNHYQNESRK